MIDDKSKVEKGFAGLSSWGSKVKDIEPEETLEAKTAATEIILPDQRTEPTRESPDDKISDGNGRVNSGKNSGGLGGGWIIGVFGIVVLIVLSNFDSQGDKAESSTPATSASDHSQTSKSATTAVASLQ